jgi:hypothetical protein
MDQQLKPMSGFMPMSPMPTAAAGFSFPAATSTSDVVAKLNAQLIQVRVVALMQNQNQSFHVAFAKYRFQNVGRWIFADQYQPLSRVSIFTGFSQIKDSYVDYGLYFIFHCLASSLCRQILREIR